MSLGIHKTRHSFTGFTPLEVESCEKKQDIVLLKFGEKYRKLKKKNPIFSVEDEVRILLFKSPFHRFVVIFYLINNRVLIMNGNTIEWQVQF